MKHNNSLYTFKHDNEVYMAQRKDIGFYYDLLSRMAVEFTNYRYTSKRDSIPLAS